MAATNTATNLAAQVAQATDIRDIRPLVEIPNYWLWLWLALALVGIAGLAFWWWRARTRRSADAPPAPPLPAHVLARRRLEEALALLGQPKPFIIAVSNSLRGYLEDAFQLRAPEQTTEEFLADLRQSPQLSEGQKSSLGDFLESCDLVKFAQYEPLESELRQLHAYALDLVAETEPTPKPMEDSREANRSGPSKQPDDSTSGTNLPS